MRYALSIVRETERRRIQQFRLAVGVEARDVRNDARNNLSVFRGEREFALRPLRHEGVEVVVVPDRGVPSIRDEKLRFHFVGLEVTDVDNPDASGITRSRKRHLLVCLCHVSASHMRCA